LILGAWLASTAVASAQAGNADTKTVTASYYSNRYNGRRTANGQHFSNNALTAAHRSLPFGTKVKLTNTRNNRSVVVRINDRGPFVKGREMSVTRLAAQRLGFVRAGTASVTMEVLGAQR
jgi:rare lipoprotein A